MLTYISFTNLKRARQHTLIFKLFLTLLSRHLRLQNVHQTKEERLAIKDYAHVNEKTLKAHGEPKQNLEVGARWRQLVGKKYLASQQAVFQLSKSYFYKTRSAKCPIPGVFFCSNSSPYLEKRFITSRF